MSWSTYQVCCDYVRSPLTLYGRKFDVRFFLMLRSAGDRSVSMREGGRGLVAVGCDGSHRSAAAFFLSLPVRPTAPYLAA